MINYFDYFRKDGTQDRELIEMLNRAYQQGRADAIDEVIRAIDEQNYCMHEECHFNACRSEGCPINRNAEVIFQSWLKKLKEQKNDSNNI